MVNVCCTYFKVVCYLQMCEMQILKKKSFQKQTLLYINLLTPNDPYSGSYRTANL